MKFWDWWDKRCDENGWMGHDPILSPLKRGSDAAARGDFATAGREYDTAGDRGSPDGNAMSAFLADREGNRDKAIARASRAWNDRANLGRDTARLTRRGVQMMTFFGTVVSDGEITFPSLDPLSPACLFAMICALIGSQPGNRERLVRHATEGFGDPATDGIARYYVATFGSSEDVLDATANLRPNSEAAGAALIARARDQSERGFHEQAIKTLAEVSRNGRRCGEDTALRAKREAARILAEHGGLKGKVKSGKLLADIAADRQDFMDVDELLQPKGQTGMKGMVDYE